MTRRFISEKTLAARRSQAKFGRTCAAAALCAMACVFAAQPAAARGRGADGDFDERSSAHFVLHQDVAIDEAGGFHGSRRFEQQVLEELERAYVALDRWLGLRPERKLDVVVYDPQLFDAHFGGIVRFPAAGFYHGVIRVRGATRLDDRLSSVLHHELVHAALDAAAPSFGFPGWVNEGGAEWFEARVLGKRGLSGAERSLLEGAARSGELHGLGSLSVPGFGGMDRRAAQIAYIESYGLIAYLAHSYDDAKLAQFFAELIRSRHLERTLRRVYRLDASTLEARFREDLG